MLKIRNFDFATSLLLLGIVKQEKIKVVIKKDLDLYFSIGGKELFVENLKRVFNFRECKRKVFEWLMEDLKCSRNVVAIWKPHVILYSSDETSAYNEFLNKTVGLGNNKTERQSIEKNLNDAKEQGLVKLVKLEESQNG